MTSERMQVLAVCLAVSAVGLSATNTRPIERSYAGSMSYPSAHATQDTLYSFARDVLPILERSCLECHGATGSDGEVVIEEGLNMTTYEDLMAGSLYGTVVEPGDPDASYLVELVVAGDMPKEGDPLAPGEIEIISAWIAAGAENN